MEVKKRGRPFSVKPAECESEIGQIVMKLTGLQNLVEEDLRELKKSTLFLEQNMALREGTILNKQALSDKLVERNHEKLQELIKDSYNLTSGNMVKITDILKQCVEDTHIQADNATAALQDSTIMVRILIGLSVLNTLFSFMFLYRFLTWLR